MFASGRHLKAGCTDRISEIMQAVYSLARLDRMFTGFSEMTGS